MGKSLEILAVFIAILVTSSGQYHHGLCRPGDIVFVLDSSNSIWHSDFDLQLEFVRDVVTKLPITPGGRGFRVGLVTFSHKVRLQFHLDYHTERSALNRAIMRVPYLGGGTYTGDAIRYVSTQMFQEARGSRAKANHFMVVVTDGLSQNTTATAVEASLARYRGVEMFVVGVGPGVDQDELESIASNPDRRYLFKVEDFTGLTSIKDKLALRICEPSPNRDFASTDSSTDTGPDAVLPPKPPQNCGGKPAEVFFLLDASSSIWHPDFEKQMSFMDHIIRIFDIGPTRTRVGVIVFSDRVHPVIMLNTYESKGDLIRAIPGVPYLTGGTDTAAAIRYMREKGFTKSVARNNAAHIGIILTDGQSQDVEATREQARLAHKEGIYLFAIGIGSNVDKMELRDIASDPDETFVFMLDNYDALTSIQDILAIKTCDVKPVTSAQNDAEVCSRQFEMDLIFGIDPNDLRTGETKLVLEFVTDVVGSLDVGPEKIRVGLMVNDCPSYRGQTVADSHFSKKAFTRALDSTHVPQMSHLLHKIRRHSFPARASSRTDVPRVAVVFVTGALDKQREALKEAHRLKRHGVELFVIAIGAGPDHYDISSMSSSPTDRHLLRVASFEQLENSNTEVLRRLCDVNP